MAHPIEIAERLAKSFVAAVNKENAAKELIREINGLYYEASGKSLIYKDKVYIVELVKEYLTRQRPFSYKDGGKILIVESRDNKMYLDMIDYILTQLDK